MTNFSNDSDFRRSEEGVLKILDEAPVGIIRFNADGIIDYVNPAFSKMGNFYHLKTSSILGANIFEDEIIPDISFTKETAELREGYIFEKEVKSLKTVDGSEISIIIKGSPLFEENYFAGGVLIIEDLQLAAEAKEDIFLKLTSLQNIIKETVDLLFIIDKNGTIKHSAGNKLNLISKENIKEIKIQELIPNLPPDFNKRITDVLSKAGEVIFEAELKIGEEQLLYECKISPLPEKQKVPRYLSCIFKDMTLRKKSEEQVEALRLFKTAAETISDGLFEISAKGIITNWYSSAEVFTGFSSEETLGKPIWNFIPLLNEESFEQLIKDLQQQEFIKKQTTINKKSGQTDIIDASFFRENNEDILISFFSDSEHKEIEFKALEENFRNLVTQSNEIIIRLDAIGNIQYVNPAFTSLLRFTEEEVIGKSLSEFIDTSQSIVKDTLKLFEQKTKDLELQLISKPGSPVNFIANIIPLKKEDTLTGYNIYLFDFSEKKKEESSLRFFKSLFENIREGIAIESNGKIIIANDSFSKLFGYSSKELTGKDVLDLVSTGDALKVAEYLQHKHSNIETPGSFEFIGKKKDGAKFNSEIVLSSFEAEGRSFIILINRDITERRRALQSIRESEEKYRNLIENIDDFLYAFEKKGTFFKPVFYTASVEKITGYTQAEMLRDLKQLFKIIHPDDFAHVKENLKNLIRSKTRISIEIEFRIINKLGNMVWVRNKINSVRDENGEVKKIFGLVSDITLRKKSESDLQKSTQNLMKLNETKDKFISIISHDLRTPFSSILGFTDLMLNDETLTNEEKDQYVRYIQESSNAMLSLVNSLLNWTRLQTGRIHFEPERVRASEIITKSIKALAGTAFQKKITLSSTVPDDIHIFVDQDLIAQVFNNLISNAIKFTKEDGNITITAKPSSHLRFYEFSVKDTGMGIKTEDQEKLFGVDNKFTTEGTAGEKGTGLGLSLVKEIIEKHDGTIKVESEFEKGSDFIFTLPVAAANILLVDPKITDKILYSKILKHITPDYSIDTASDGKEALDKILSSTYALIITEHKTQEMTGYELALELKKLDMKVKPPIIVLSSSIDRQTVDDYNEIGVNYVFQKPVDLSSFKLAVEKSLRQTLTNN